MNFFDFLNAINENKKDLIREDPLSEKEYNSFMINRGLSYFPDTILYANEMNRAWDTPKQWQFDFYRLGISKRRRFSKWHKQDKIEEDVKLLMREYDYSHQKAMQVFNLLNEDQIEKLRQKYKTGGR
mgnify:CR=1 FL=1